MKKLLTSILCLTATVCIGAGGITMFTNASGEDTEGPKEEITTCSNNHSNEFLLGSWVSYIWQAPEGQKPPTLAEQVKMLADAGLNFNIRASEADEIGDETIGDDIGKLEFWTAVDEVYKANDMYYGFCNHNDDWRCLTKPSYLTNDSEAGLNRAKEFSPYLDNLIFYMVKDEPSIGSFEYLAEWCKKYVGIKDGVYPWVNLLPSYAGSNAIGSSYYDYLDGWVQAVGAENQEYLSHDFYVFHENSSNLNFFADVEAMRQVGLKYDLKTHGFPQAQGWNGMRTPTVDEMRWNDYAYLAYGFKALSYFNWSWWGGEGNDGGLIGKYGEPEDPEKYEQAVALNWELRALSDIIMNVDCLHAYHTRNNIAGVEYLPENWLINPSLGSDLVISYMRARDNTEPYFMIFNKSFTNSASTEFTVDKYSGITGLEYFNPNTKSYEEVEIKDGKFSLDLRPGEGKYLRIKGDVNLPAELTTPKADLEERCYIGNQTVTLTAGSKTDKIYYTLDGSFPEPKEENLYTEPFALEIGDEVSKNILLRTIAVRGKSYSELTEKSYLLVNEANADELAKLTEVDKQGDWMNDGDTILYGVNELTAKITLKQAVESGAATLLDPEWTADGESYYIHGWENFDRKIEYIFTGTGIKVNVNGGDGYGIIDFYIDGEKIDGTYDAATFEGAKDIVQISDLGKGEHTLLINFSGYADCRGKKCEVNGFTVTDTNESVPVDPYETRISLKSAVESGKATLLDPEWTADGESYYIHGWAGFDRKIEYTFTGTGIKVNLCGGSNMGFVSFYLDDEELNMVDASAFYGNRDIVLGKGLKAGEHTLLINFTGYAECRAKKCKINGFAVTTSETIAADSGEKVSLKQAVESGAAKLLDPEWTAEGDSYYIYGWPGFDRKIEYTFTGTGIKVNLRGRSECGIVDFYIDGEQKGVCDSATFVGKKDAFIISGLENKEHVLLINFSGYADCKAKRCQVNGFVVSHDENQNPAETGETKVSLKQAVESGAAKLLDPEWTAEGNSYYIHGWEGFDRKIEYNFTGRGIKVSVTGGENMGIITFYLDGVLQKGIYDASKFTGVQDIFSIIGLENKEHVLLINFSGYTGCRGKKCQVNGFTVVNEEKYNFYREAKNISSDYVACVELDIRKGEAGFYVEGENARRMFVTLDSLGIVSVTDEKGYLFRSAFNGDFDKSAVKFFIVRYNGNCSIYVNGAKVATLNLPLAENGKVGLYASRDAEVIFGNAKIGEITVNEIVRTEAVVSFVEPKMVIIEPKSTVEEALNILPKTVNLLLSDGSTIEANVTWTVEDYDAEVPGKYRFTATIVGDIGYANPFDIEVYAYGFLCEEVDYTYIDSIIALVDSLDSSKYTVASWAAVEEYYKIAVESRADRTNFTNQLTVAGMQLMNKVDALENPSLVWSAFDAAIEELKAVDLTLYTQVSGQNLSEKLQAMENMPRLGLIEQSDIDAAAAEGRKAAAELDLLVVTADELSAWIAPAEEAVASGNYTEESVAALQAVLDRIAELEEKEGKSVIDEIKSELNNKYLALIEKNTDSASDSGSGSQSGSDVATGCGSALGGLSLLSLGVLGVLGMAFKKRKND